nr:transporter substrate-binding domain-containing protein [uncultured Pseudomonas sp.]
MAGWWFAALLGVFCAVSAQAGDAPATQPTIRLASEVWEDYTNADGTGLAWDILRQVFEPAGVKVVIQSVPYTRSIGLVQRGEADAWVGSYLDEVDERVHYPHWHYDTDRISALGLNTQPMPSLANLGRFRLVWMRGYEYQRYLPGLHDYGEVLRRDNVLDMLNHGRADFYIDASSEVEEVLGEAADPSHYRVTELTHLPVYLGFTASPRGRELARLYDQRMEALVTRGSLRPLFERWQQPYPFD